MVDCFAHEAPPNQSPAATPEPPEAQSIAVSKRPALQTIAPLAVASILIVLGMLLIPSAYGQGSSFLRVSYINVGQGDSIWLHASDQTDILIDGEPRTAGPTVVTYLQSRSIDDIDIMIASHNDEDHR